MAKRYRRYLPEQDLLLPPSLREWLPENHLVYFVSDVIDHLARIKFFLPNYCNILPLQRAVPNFTILTGCSSLRGKRYECNCQNQPRTNI